MNILENKLESMQVESIIIMIMILHFNFLLLSRHWCSLKKKKKNGLWIRDKLRGIKLKKKTNADSGKLMFLHLFLALWY